MKLFIRQMNGSHSFICDRLGMLFSELLRELQSSHCSK